MGSLGGFNSNGELLDSSGGLFNNLGEFSINISAFLGGLIELLGGISDGLCDLFNFGGKSGGLVLTLNSSGGLGYNLQLVGQSLDGGGLGIVLLLAVLGFTGGSFLSKVSSDSGAVELFLGFSLLLGSLECFLLGLNDFLGGNLFLDSGLDSGDGGLNFSDESHDVSDLDLNDLDLLNKEIHGLLGGDLGGEVLVLGLDLLLDGNSEFLNLEGQLLNGGLGDESSFSCGSCGAC